MNQLIFGKDLILLEIFSETSFLFIGQNLQFFELIFQLLFDVDKLSLLALTEIELFKKKVML